MKIAYFFYGFYFLKYGSIVTFSKFDFYIERSFRSKRGSDIYTFQVKVCGVRTHVRVIENLTCHAEAWKLYLFGAGRQNILKDEFKIGSHCKTLSSIVKINCDPKMYVNRRPFLIFLEIVCILYR